VSDISAIELQRAMRDARQLILQRIRDVRLRLDSLEQQLEQDRVINSMGELQQLGPQLDAAVASFATLQCLNRGD
jgi:hypothetical protein